MWCDLTHSIMWVNLMENHDSGENVARHLAAPGLANALESGRFKQFLDQMPVAIAVSELAPPEVITYVNFEFETLTGLGADAIQGKSWGVLPGIASRDGDATRLGDAVRDDAEYIGAFTIENGGVAVELDAWSNTIEDDGGTPSFRLLALATVADHRRETDAAQADSLRAKDPLLLELQHRVKNNLQMITALIRMEARNARDEAEGERFERLQGRITALSHLYTLLSDEGGGDSVDLGVYISQVASSVIQAHAVEGIRLEIAVDTWPVSINVAMPTGLVVNELLTNALKHAFADRPGGTISLTCLVDGSGCRVTVADDGIGLAPGTSWPSTGKLGALIVQSLRLNAGATIEIHSTPGKGVRAEIFFARAAAVP